MREAKMLLAESRRNRRGKANKGGRAFGGARKLTKPGSKGQKEKINKRDVRGRRAGTVLGGVT